ncbi:MAG: AraC family transcriptional regulator [Gemmatimonadales bacterium]|nr:MAG: AraC family transcriptional regulator [Gemmatimonadales bacterium]
MMRAMSLMESPDGVLSIRSRRCTMTSSTASPFSLFAPPYQELMAIDTDEDFPDDPKTRGGAALVWILEKGHDERHLERIAGRPGGIPLLVMLPKSGTVSRVRSRVLKVLEDARPQAVLPFHPRPEVGELRLLLRAEPEDLAGEVLDYLWWRGLRLRQENRQILRRTVELSAELRTLSALSRGLYISRRALGRRFRRSGIPVPSHWLQFCRLLRACIRLQNRHDSLCRVASSLGYPDGFTLSNQMQRLIGIRPSAVRKRLGWEWVLEAWLYQEWLEGGLDIWLRGFPERHDPPDLDSPARAKTKPQPPEAVRERTGSKHPRVRKRAM